MHNTLRTVYDLLHKPKELLQFVAHLNRDDLLLLHDRIGLDEQPGRNQCVKGRKRIRGLWGKIASRVPIELHAMLAARLWPDIFNPPPLPRMPMTATIVSVAVNIMTARVIDGRSVWHPDDKIEYADRGRKFSGQLHLFKPEDSNAKPVKGSRKVVYKTVSKMMAQENSSGGNCTAAITIEPRGTTPVYRAASCGMGMKRLNAKRMKPLGAIPKLRGLPEDKRRQILNKVCAKLKAMRAKK